MLSQTDAVNVQPGPSPDECSRRLNPQFLHQDSSRSVTISQTFITTHRTLKGKLYNTPQDIGGCSSPSSRPWARSWRTSYVCDVWPVWHQTYGYLSNRKASPPIGWYQIILPNIILYTVSRKKVTPCIHCHNSDKQCRILTEFWNNNAMSNCKQITKFK